MTGKLTIRDVPGDVRDALGREARGRGQSLQAYLLSVLTRQASFVRNRQLLDEIDRDLAVQGGADEGAPDAAAVIDQARSARDSGSGAPGQPTAA